MKTLEKGRPQKGWSKEFKCTGAGNGGGGCGAKLLVEEGDLFLTESFDLPNNETHCTFMCQECGVLTDLTYQQRPPGWSLLPSYHIWKQRHRSNHNEVV